MARTLALYRVSASVLHPLPYTMKLLVVAFVGTHLPLLTLLAYLILIADADLAAHLDILGIVLIGTLLATALTLTAIWGLLAPLDATRAAVNEYLDHRRLLPLPEHYPDAAGLLMRDVGYTLRQLDRQLAELERESTADPLTGALNRRGGEAALAESLAATRATDSVMVLLKVDVHGVRSVNERHGHAVGDRCLRAVVDEARDTLRPTDWIARWEGAVFMAVVVADEAEIGVSVEQRLERALADIRVETPAGTPPIRLQASLGSAVATTEDTPETLFARADDALAGRKVSRAAA